MLDSLARPYIKDGVGHIEICPDLLKSLLYLVQKDGPKNLFGDEVDIEYEIAACICQRFDDNWDVESLREFYRMEGLEPEEEEEQPVIERRLYTREERDAQGWGDLKKWLL